MTSQLPFATLCHELVQLQVGILRRDGMPAQLAREALQLICRNHCSVDCARANAACVPVFLRCCATVFRHVNDLDSIDALDALAVTHHVTASYLHERYGDVNEASTVLRAILVLYERQARAARQSGQPVGLTVRPESDFATLQAPAFDHAFRMWQEVQQLRNVQPHSLSVLSLLKGSDAVYGQDFCFSSTTAEKTGLLPCKSKLQMEAKVQRCRGARELLWGLQHMELSRLDAGMSLATMAETGLYDAVVCDRSCDVLYGNHALLTSQQLVETLYHLGTLQHRHVHQKFFASLVECKRCTAEAVRRYVVGLAMLRQPPPCETRLMDGVFLHALRASHAGHRRGKSNERGVPGGAMTSLQGGSSTRGTSVRHEDVAAYELPPSWYVDVAHALSCLDVVHPKFKLLTARQARRCIAALGTAERCKLLYAVGGLPLAQVPPDLRDSWRRKVDPVIRIVADKLCDIAPEDGPRVMKALLYCGVTQHPRVVPRDELPRTADPVALLLRTWSTASKESILQLTEQLGEASLGDQPSTTLARVAAAVADGCAGVDAGRTLQYERYRLAPLCAAVTTHAAGMSPREALQTLDALQRMGLDAAGEPALQSLLDRLWSERRVMSAEERQLCNRLLGSAAACDQARQMLHFLAAPDTHNSAPHAH